MFLRGATKLVRHKQPEVANFLRLNVNRDQLLAQSEEWVPKQAEARRFFGLIMEEVTPQVHRAMVWHGFLLFQHCALLNLLHSQAADTSGDRQGDEA